MLRSAFIYLSRRKTLQRRLLRLPGAGKLASQFVAGETLDQALAVARDLNQKGFLATLDHLGENVRTPEAAAAARDAYLEILAQIGLRRLQAQIAVKPTQLGMDVSEQDCLANLRALVEAADRTDGFVEVDMEGSAYTGRTLSVVRQLRRDHASVGVCIQAYLHRSEADLQQLVSQGIRVRLCKGAYSEPPSLALARKSDVNENFIRLMQILLTSGHYHGIATHDPHMIAQTRLCADTLGLAKDRFEFQMLYGIQRPLQARLVQEGYRLRVYIPFGTEWFPYFMRRLAERPANVWFAFKSLFR